MATAPAPQTARNKMIRQRTQQHNKEVPRAPREHKREAQRPTQEQEQQQRREELELHLVPLPPPLPPPKKKGPQGGDGSMTIRSQSL